MLGGEKETSTLGPCFCEKSKLCQEIDKITMNPNRLSRKAVFTKKKKEFMISEIAMR
jgi:hypothetical protein